MSTTWEMKKGDLASPRIPGLLATQASPVLRLVVSVAGKLVWGLALSRPVPKTPAHCTTELLLREILDPQIGKAVLPFSSLGIGAPHNAQNSCQTC